MLGRAAITFIAVEALLGIIGGLSATALYVAFAFLDGSMWVLAVSTALIGGLVGAEVPLLMTLLQQGRVRPDTDPAPDTGRTLADLNAADYHGALIGGLSWPFVPLPQLGMIRGAAVTGIVNWWRPGSCRSSCRDASWVRATWRRRCARWPSRSRCWSRC
jgi:spermidine synthase